MRKRKRRAAAASEGQSSALEPEPPHQVERLGDVVEEAVRSPLDAVTAVALGAQIPAEPRRRLHEADIQSAGDARGALAELVRRGEPGDPSANDHDPLHPGLSWLSMLAGGVDSDRAREDRAVGLALGLEIAVERHADVAHEEPARRRAR